MATSQRCPQCGALVGEAAEWCTQCYADLRPRAPEPAAPASPAQPPPAPAPGPVTEDGGAGDAAEPPAAPTAPARHRASDEDAPEPGWPCPQCGTVNDLAAGACSACGSGFLAGLAADRGIPLVPGLSGRSRGGRIAVALAAIVAFLLLLAGVFWLLS